MAHLSVPYLVRKGAAHAPRWYWQPSAELRRAGWRPRRLLRPDGRPCRTAGEAADAARQVNLELEVWRTVTASPPPAPRTVAALIDRFLARPDWRRLAPKTRADYGRHLALIRERFGTRPVDQLRRAELVAWHDGLAAHAPAAAAAAWRTLARLLAHAVRLDWLAANPTAGQRVAATAVRVRPWTDAEAAAIVAAADRQGRHDVGDLIVAALTTGQRRGDLIALDRATASGTIWKITQQKTGATAYLPVLAALAHRLEAADGRRKRAAVVRPERFLNEAAGWRPWSPAAAWRAFDAARAEAARTVPSAAEVTFQDTRDTALTALADVECTPFEIAAVSGHSVAGVVRRVRHYIKPTATQAANAAAKLARRTQEARDAG